MRVITAYARLIEALDVLSAAMATGIVHVPGSENQLGSLQRDVNLLRERLLATTPKQPNNQIDSQIKNEILRIYQTAYTARFLTGSESSFGEFVDATQYCTSSVKGLYASSGSESWGRFPPK